MRCRSRWLLSLVGSGQPAVVLDAVRRHDGPRSSVSRRRSPTASRWVDRQPGPRRPRLARFGFGNGQFGVLALALYLPVLAAPLRRPRLAVHLGDPAAGLVVGFGLLAVLDDRGLPVRLPEPGVLLAPVAVGLALRRRASPPPSRTTCSAARSAGASRSGCSTARRSRRDDPRRGRDRQRSLAHADGDADVGASGSCPGTRPTATPGSCGSATRGSCRSHRGRCGRGSATRSPTTGSSLENVPGRPVDAEDEITDAIDAIAAETTLRAGRLLAPYGIRYIVVPVVDGARQHDRRSAPGSRSACSTRSTTSSTWRAADQPARLRRLREHRLDADAQRSSPRPAPTPADRPGPTR